MADLKITELPVATTPAGAELVEIVQGGVNKQTTLQDIADLAPAAGIQSVVAGTNISVDNTDPANPVVSSSAAGVTDGDKGDVVVSGSGSVWTVESANESQAGKIEIATQAETNTGTDDTRAVTPLKLNTKLSLNRTVTGADALEQDDDNTIIVFDSATDFNFTLDQLTTGSKVQFMNINTGVVTFVNGTGVTVSPTAPTLSGAGSGVFPGAFVFYTSATTPILSSAYPESWLDYTPTFVGFSADPTGVTARYTLIGKTCTVRMFMTAGTSNATNFTITLPFTAAAGRVVHSIVIMNNGITQAGRCDTTGGSNILTMHASPAGGVWTNSGNKAAFFCIQYEIE